jgi:hypothetical protein
MCHPSNQRMIKDLPWDKELSPSYCNCGRGRITDIMGYGCSVAKYFEDAGKDTIVFFHSKHGMCELFDSKKF